MKDDKMLKALAKAQNKSKRIEKYYSGLTPKCKSEVVSEVRIKPEEFLKDMGYSEIIKTPEGIIDPSFQWLTVINLLKEYDSRKEYKDLSKSEVSEEEIGKAADDYAFQVPYDGTKDFYNKTKHKSFQDGIKWMQDKFYGSKKECWGCYKKLPKGHKSGLCSDCQIRG